MLRRELEAKSADYSAILSKHLKRKRTVDEIQDHPRYPFTPRYVVDMLDDALKVVQRKNPDATFEELRRADRLAMGHVDYFDKMCLYLIEIEEKRFP